MKRTKKRISLILSLVIVFSVILQMAILPTVAHAATAYYVVSGSNDGGWIRSGPGTAYTGLEYVYNGQEVVCTEISGNWRYVYFYIDGSLIDKGWMHYSVVHEYTSKPIKEAQATDGTGYVNLRATANGTILEQVTNGQMVIVITAGTTWDYVLYNGVKGYCYNPMLESPVERYCTGSLWINNTYVWNVNVEIASAFDSQNWRYQYKYQGAYAWGTRSLLQTDLTDCFGE